MQALALHADHRPERAQAWAAAAMTSATATSATATSAKRQRDPPALPVARPLWLVAEPRALDADPATAQLQLLCGPERIESGWWDGSEIGRDYFVGRDAQGENLWLYRDRGGAWFVHGVFA